MQPIPNYPNYFVTATGEVWSAKSGCLILRKSRPDKHGYLRLSLFRQDGQHRRNVGIHQLVAETYLSNSLNLPQVNHKDGVKTNNNVDNLEWCTSLHNIQHAISSGLRVQHGDHNCNAVLSPSDVLYIRSVPCVRGTTATLARMFGVDHSTIAQVIKRKTWRHI
jgi:hypothetical protein